AGGSSSSCMTRAWSTGPSASCRTAPHAQHRCPTSRCPKTTKKSRTPPSSCGSSIPGSNHWRPCS
ncbi:Isoleucine--tRNA ligase, cytoplasmic, partial [Symbiodinium microadriaticum]